MPAVVSSLHSSPVPRPSSAVPEISPLFSTSPVIIQSSPSYSPPSIHENGLRQRSTSLRSGVSYGHTPTTTPVRPTSTHSAPPHIADMEELENGGEGSSGSSGSPSSKSTESSTGSSHDSIATARMPHSISPDMRSQTNIAIGVSTSPLPTSLYYSREPVVSPVANSSFYGQHEGGNDNSCTFSFSLPAMALSKSGDLWQFCSEEVAQEENMYEGAAVVASNVNSETTSPRSHLANSLFNFSYCGGPGTDRASSTSCTTSNGTPRHEGGLSVGPISNNRWFTDVYQRRHSSLAEPALRIQSQLAEYSAFAIEGQVIDDFHAGPHPTAGSIITTSSVGFHGAATPMIVPAVANAAGTGPAGAMPATAPFSPLSSSSSWQPARSSVPPTAGVHASRTLTIGVTGSGVASPRNVRVLRGEFDDRDVSLDSGRFLSNMRSPPRASRLRTPPGCPITDADAVLSVVPGDLSRIPLRHSPGGNPFEADFFGLGASAPQLRRSSFSATQSFGTSDGNGSVGQVEPGSSQAVLSAVGWKLLSFREQDDTPVMNRTNFTKDKRPKKKKSSEKSKKKKKDKGRDKDKQSRGSRGERRTLSKDKKSSSSRSPSGHNGKGQLSHPPISGVEVVLPRGTEQSRKATVPSVKSDAAAARPHPPKESPPVENAWSKYQEPPPQRQPPHTSPPGKRSDVLRPSISGEQQHQGPTFPPFSPTLPAGAAPNGTAGRRGGPIRSASRISLVKNNQKTSKKDDAHRRTSRENSLACVKSHDSRSSSGRKPVARNSSSHRLNEKKPNGKDTHAPGKINGNDTKGGSERRASGGAASDAVNETNYSLVNRSGKAKNGDSTPRGGNGDPPRNSNAMMQWKLPPI